MDGPRTEPAGATDTSPGHTSLFEPPPPHYPLRASQGTSNPRASCAHENLLPAMAKPLRPPGDKPCGKGGWGRAREAVRRDGGPWHGHTPLFEPVPPPTPPCGHAARLSRAQRAVRALQTRPQNAPATQDRGQALRPQDAAAPKVASPTTHTERKGSGSQPVPASAFSARAIASAFLSLPMS